MDGIPGEEFDFNSLPLPKIENLPVRGIFRLLPCGATASVAVDDSDLQRLFQTNTVTEFTRIGKEIAATKQIFIVQRTPNSYQIASYLEEKNVPVERLRKHIDGVEIPLEKNEYLSERLGAENVQNALVKASPQERLEILTGFADTLGEIHKAGVAYGSNHLGNMILGPDKRIFFIDFKTSRLVTLNWNTTKADDIYQLFGIDLATLVVGNLRNIGCSDEEVETTLKSVVKKYPVDNKVQDEILSRLM